MAVANPVPPVSAPDSDIFSISDAHLAQELQFIKEARFFCLIYPRNSPLTRLFTLLSLTDRCGQLGMRLAMPAKGRVISSFAVAEACRCQAGLQGEETNYSAACQVSVRTVQFMQRLNGKLTTNSWNEMKIVRSLRDDPHPSIVPFHSFIITPSFAMITM